ncbi:hypothetical protein, partial [Pseudomonas sp. SIMBA_068]|uniref:hypothetical protein n=1 Tax=Pseudomonas sp. SIMBA_068 TaxID=3085808 RepID=UPI00397D1381
AAIRAGVGGLVGIHMSPVIRGGAGAGEPGGAEATRRIPSDVMNAAASSEWCMNTTVARLHGSSRTRMSA